MMIGFDDGAKRYVAHWCDSYGGKFSAIGYGKRSGNSIEFEFSFPTVRSTTPSPGTRTPPDGPAGSKMPARTASACSSRKTPSGGPDLSRAGRPRVLVAYNPSNFHQRLLPSATRGPPCRIGGKGSRHGQVQISRRGPRRARVRSPSRRPPTRRPPARGPRRQHPGGRAADRIRGILFKTAIDVSNNTGTAAQIDFHLVATGGGEPDHGGRQHLVDGHARRQGTGGTVRDTSTTTPTISWIRSCTPA